MRNRRFGVELEFGTNEDVGPDGVRDWIWGAQLDNDWGNIGWDGSEVEVRSPILQGEKGFKELKQVIDLLNYNGCYVTESDGLHVHHDAPEFVNDKALVVKLLKSWKYNENLIASFIDEHRADYALHEPDDSPCPTFALESIWHYEKPNGHSFYYRHNLNILALREHGSIELRFHEGTLNWLEIESWIRFGQSFINSVKKRKNPIMPAESPVVLLNRLKTNDRAKQFLIRKSSFA